MRWWPPPWWCWPAAVALLVIACMVGWFFTDLDWRRLEARARAGGLSLTDPPPGSPPLNGAVAWQTRPLIALGNTILPGFIDSSQLPDGQRLAEWTAKLTQWPAELAKLEAGCDALPTQPFSDDPGPWGGGWWRQSLYPTLTASIATCPVEELPARMHRLLRVAQAGMGPDILSLNAIVAACTFRLRDLAGDAEVADVLQTFIDVCIQRRANLAERMVVVLAQALHDQTSPMQAARQLGLPLSKWEEFPPLLALEIRSQRENVIASWIDHVVSLRAHPDPATWPWVYPRRSFDQVNGLKDMSCHPGRQRGQARSLLRASVVLAELRGAPWPRDWFDPSGSPIRRVERDGRLIGAYCVGDDGVDDGGDRSKDLCWPLYGQLGTPRAAAELPPPAKPQPQR